MILTTTLQRIFARRTFPNGNAVENTDLNSIDVAALAKDELLMVLPHSEGWESVFTLFSSADLGLAYHTAASYVQYLEIDHVQTKIDMNGYEAIGAAGYLQYRYRNNELSYSYSISEKIGNGVKTERSSFTLADPHYVFLRYLAQRRRRQELGLCERCGRAMTRNDRRKRNMRHDGCHRYCATTIYGAGGALGEDECSRLRSNDL